MNLRVAAIQLSPFRQDYSSQLDKITRLVTQASRLGAKVICLPELMTTPYFARTQDTKWRKLAEPLQGETYQHIAELARNLACTIIATCYESLGDKRYNTAFVVGPEGELAGRYAKTHIPWIEAVSAYETMFFDAGDALPVFAVDGIRVGILICYDRSFPEAWRALALKGAQVIFVPTSSSGSRGSLYAEELRVAAAQQQVFVVAANKAGEEFLDKEPGSITFYGKSQIISPFGTTIAALEGQEDCVLTAAIDLNDVSAARKAIPYYQTRRTDLY